MLRLLRLLAVAFVIAVAFAAPDAKAEIRQITVAADGSGDFRTIDAALATIPRNNSGRVVVFVKNGVYYEKVRIDQNRVTLRGESRDGVRLRYNHPRSEYDKRYDRSGGPAVLNVYGEDDIVEHLTIENVQPTKEHSFGIYGQPQRFILDDVSALGVGGDTVSLWNTAYGMYYHRNCKFSGGVDYLCPRGWCYVRDSQFESPSTSATIWHDGHMDLDMKFTLRNCSFDGVENFNLGRNGYPAQFYLLDCKFTKNMADKPIALAGDTSKFPDKSVFTRHYYFNCHRDGGDYAWFADNLDKAPGASKPEAITASWTFDGRWDPESKAPPAITAVETSGDAVQVYFSEDVAGAMGAEVVREDGSKAKYEAGDGTRRLTFRGGGASSALKTLNAGASEIYGTVATLDKRALAATTVLPAAQPRREITILLVGDSTVAVDPVKNSYQGWGSPLGEFFDDRVKIVNMARNGRSSLSFRAEGLWDEARKTKADYVVIQFGHNDNLGKGPGKETDPKPGGEFRANLARYVDEARAMGAKAILVSPPTRRVFENGLIKTDEANVPYAEATLAVAEEKKVPVVDLNRLSREQFDRLGEASSHWTQVEEDRTHFTPAGARRIAAIVLTDLQKSVPELKPFVLQDELWRH